MSEAQELADHIERVWRQIEAAAELRRLDEVEGDYQRLLEKHNNLHMNHMRLQAECEQLRADAARYRWLVARPLNGEDEFYISAQDSIQANADGWWALGGDMSKSEADAYIDAAMKETK